MCASPAFRWCYVRPGSGLLSHAGCRRGGPCRPPAMGSVRLLTPAEEFRVTDQLDSNVHGSALYAAITCCPQSPDCCLPCRGIGVRVAPDSAPSRRVLRFSCRDSAHHEVSQTILGSNGQHTRRRATCRGVDRYRLSGVGRLPVPRSARRRVAASWTRSSRSAIRRTPSPGA